MSKNNNDLSDDLAAKIFDSDAFVPLSTEIDEGATQSFCMQCEAVGVSVIVEHVELRELDTSWPAFRLLVPLSHLEQAAVIFDRVKSSNQKKAAA